MSKRGAAIAVVLSLATAACAQEEGKLDPPTPPLLKGATSAGDGWGAGFCPQTGSIHFEGIENHSPQIEARLKAAFPAGTPEAVLVKELSKQGFKLDEPCELEPSIHRAWFIQSGGGFYGPYPAASRVAWKVDGEGRIVWTRADIAWTGP